MKILAELRLRHAVVIEARKALGWTQLDLARIAGVSVSPLSKLECLQFGCARVREIAPRIADALALEYDEVLPPDMTENIVSSHCATREVANAALLAQETHVRRMVLPSPADVVTEINLADVTQQALTRLNPREREILELRYGLNDAQPHTLDACAKMFNVTRECVRQIEERALAKLRQPYNAWLFDDIIDV